MTEAKKRGHREAATNSAKRYRLFLFGSALYSDNPDDLDILVVYEDSVTAIEALRFRIKLISKLKKYASIPLHVMLLSEREEREVGFTNAENCRLLTRRELRRLMVTVSNSLWR